MKQFVNLKNYNRIMLVGSGGSGKSWLSKRIREITGHSLIHLDNEFWQPGWVETPREEWIEKQKSLIQGEKWIMDGNYNRTMELRFSAADLIIFLDINRFVCIWGAIRRTGKKRSDLPQYLDEPNLTNREFFDFCKWIWAFPGTGRKTIMKLHGMYPGKRFLQIKSRKGMKRLLRANECASRVRSSNFLADMLE